MTGARPRVESRNDAPNAGVRAPVVEEHADGGEQARSTSLPEERARMAALDRIQSAALNAAVAEAKSLREELRSLEAEIKRLAAAQVLARKRDLDALSREKEMEDIVRSKDQEIAGLHEAAARSSAKAAEEAERLAQLERSSADAREALSEMTAAYTNSLRLAEQLGHELAQARADAASAADHMNSEVQALRSEAKSTSDHLARELARIEAQEGQIKHLASLDREATASLAVAAHEAAHLKAQLQIALSEVESAGKAALSHARTLATLDHVRAEAENEARARTEAEASLKERFREIAELSRLLIKHRLDLAQARDELSESLIKLETGVSAARAQAQAEAKAEAEALREELETAMQRLRRMEASLAWRATAPVRAMARLFRGSTRAVAGTADAESDIALLRRSSQFDSDWYLARYSDVADAGLDPVEHFLAFGAAEGRDPGPEFSSRAYLERNPDVMQAGLNPLVHYLRFGKNEGRSQR